MKWIVTAAIVGALGAAGLAWAESSATKQGKQHEHQGMMQGRMMRGGMMSMMGNMMRGNGAGMTDECAGMMRQSSDGAKKPNEQWRKDR